MMKTAAFPPVKATELGGEAARRDYRISDYFSLFGATSDPVIVASMNYRVVYLNKAAADMLEVDLQEAQLLNLHHLFSECVRNHHYDLQQAMIENGGRVTSMRVEVTGFRGKSTPCLLTVDPVTVVGQGYLIARLADNSEVEKLTYSDPLTGIHNRLYFTHKIEEEYHQLCRGTFKDLSLLFVDIDHFKQCNDTYGHRFADGVLRAVAKCMQDCARVSDSVCRYGGEELLVILPATDAAGAKVFAERLRKAIAALQLHHRERQTVVSVTVSVGVSTHQSGQVGTANLLIEEADQAMYHSKHHGRDQVTHYLDADQ